MTRKSQQLRTVEEVIAAFGGLAGCQAIFGGVLSRFCNYKAAGRFPDNMHMKIYVEAMARGLNIAPELIGMKRPGAQSELRLQAAE
jgi:hypothetical protein